MKKNIPDNIFDKAVKNRFDNHSINPSPELWENINNNLQDKHKVFKIKSILNLKSLIVIIILALVSIIMLFNYKLDKQNKKIEFLEKQIIKSNKTYAEFNPINKKIQKTNLPNSVNKTSKQNINKKPDEEITKKVIKQNTRKIIKKTVKKQTVKNINRQAKNRKNELINISNNDISENIKQTNNSNKPIKEDSENNLSEGKFREKNNEQTKYGANKKTDVVNEKPVDKIKRVKEKLQKKSNEIVNKINAVFKQVKTKITTKKLHKNEANENKINTGSNIKNNPVDSKLINTENIAKGNTASSTNLTYKVKDAQKTKSLQKYSIELGAYPMFSNIINAGKIPQAKIMMGSNLTSTFKIGYKLSERLIIKTGFLSKSCQYTIKPSDNFPNLNPQSSGFGDVRFSNIYNNSNNNNFWSSSVNFNFVEIPFELEYELNKRLNINLGIKYSKKTISNKEPIYEEEVALLNFDKIRKNNIGVSVAFTYNFHFGEHFGLNVGPTADFNLLPVYQNLDIKTYSYSVGIYGSFYFKFKNFKKQSKPF